MGLQQIDRDAYFVRVADRWKAIYLGPGLKAQIYGARAEVTLSWVKELHLPLSATVIDIGCGTGPIAVELAEWGFHVHALDSVGRMLQLTRERAESRGAQHQLGIVACDAQHLPYEDKSIDLAIALGILPWTSSPETVLDEASRVLAPGGHAIISADNSLRLCHLLDPWKNPWLSPCRRLGKRVYAQRWSTDRKAPRASMHSLRLLRSWIEKRGLEVVRATTVGFGPFSLGRRRFFAERTEVALNRRLQGLVDGGWPLIHLLGNHCLVLARKPV